MTVLAFLTRLALGQSAPTLITQEIDETKVVTLAGNTRFEAKPSNDRGALADSTPIPHMLLQLKRSPQSESALEAYVESLTDKSSPNFRHWLTPAQLGDRYGMSQSDLSTIEGWLQSHGLSVGFVYPNRMMIDISGNVGQIRSAFHTEIHALSVKGKAHIANMSDPQIPQALQAAVAGVISLHDFRPHSMIRKRKDFTFAGCATADFPTEPGNCYSLVPADYQTIYDLNPLYREGYLGQGQTIVLIEDSDTYSNDVATYRSTFLGKYLGTGSFVTTNPNAGNNCTDPGANDADDEADLDAEVASAIAPEATINVAACADSPVTFGGLIALQNILSAGSPPAIVSISYGDCEASTGQAGNAAFFSTYQTAAAAGVSVFVSAGDEGASSCSADFGAPEALTGIGVTGWGETPYNVAVGGTDFEDTYNAQTLGIPLSTYWGAANTSTFGSAKSYIPEIPWNDSCAGYNVYSYLGFPLPYGASGLCNSSVGENDYLALSAGSGGPSNCATGFGGTPQTDYLYVSGGCQGYPKPPFQGGIKGNPADGVRDIPDVSMFAADGIWGHFVTVCSSDPNNQGVPCTGDPSTWAGYGGTSVASPTMAGIQALVNQYNNTRTGNPNPVYYAIASAQYSSAGSACYSINQPARRGLAPSCSFYDITQGDIDLNCQNLTGSVKSNCYLTSGTTNGVLSTNAVASKSTSNAVILSGGVGYTTAPTCTIAAPSNLSPYLTPTGAPIFAGGTKATCTVTLSTGSLTATGTIAEVDDATAFPSGSYTVTVGTKTYTFVTALTGAYQVLIAGTSSTSPALTTQNLSAAINANSSQCSTAPCFGTGTVANTAATASYSTKNANITATATGSGFTGSFTLATNDPYDIAVSGGTNGAGPNYISALTVAAGSSGYAPNAVCTFSGGNGSGALCVASISGSTAPATYQPAYGATPGWDFATGLGSPNAYNLVHNPAW